MGSDSLARTRTLDPAVQARAQARARLPVTVCPFCGGRPGGDPDVTGARCCCLDCWNERGGAPYRSQVDRCLECPHRKEGPA